MVSGGLRLSVSSCMLFGASCIAMSITSPFSRFLFGSGLFRPHRVAWLGSPLLQALENTARQRLSDNVIWVEIGSVDIWRVFCYIFSMVELLANVRILYLAGSSPTRYLEKLFFTQ